MSYKGQVLRGEKYAYTMNEEAIKEVGGDIEKDYNTFKESEKKVKETKSKEKK